jgi:hypothetical protein
MAPEEASSLEISSISVPFLETILVSLDQNSLTKLNPDPEKTTVPYQQLFVIYQLGIE